MSADNNQAMAAMTRIEFNRSVDREILRQLTELNVRGLRAMQNLGEATLRGSSMWSRLTGPMPDEAAWRRFGDAPFLLFEWRALPDWRVNEGVEGWSGHPDWSNFARLATHMSAEICRNRRPAARFLLGMSAEQCEAWARLSWADIDLHAQRASRQIDLRWGTDLRYWQQRLQAAALPGDEALWRNTLEGMQRLAALARPRG